EGIYAQSPMGIVIAARELGKSDFLSVGHDFLIRKNVGKKWVCLLKSVGKVESNEVFCRAVEEEEGGEKLVESLIEEELKAGEVIYNDVAIRYTFPFIIQRVDRCNDHCNDRCDD
ncbi:hypothetical protein L249_1944, partial [Ophiocordyceps polyrhachis-furcata BCC 54312]